MIDSLGLAKTLNAIEGKVIQYVPFTSRRKPITFKVFYSDYPSKLMVFFAKVVERRSKKRGYTFEDYLAKARRDKSDHVVEIEGTFIVSSNYEIAKK
jgi:hypothetical protein